MGQSTTPPAAVKRIVWGRDGRKCRRCSAALAKPGDCHIDHVEPRPVRPDNRLRNLRALCRRCWVLRCHPEKGHLRPGAVPKALKDGVVPPDWRAHVWEG